MSFYSYLSLLQKWIQDAAFIVFSCLISLDSLNLEHMLAQSLSFLTLTFLKTTGQWFCRMHLNWGYQIFPYDLIQTMHSVVFYTHIKLQQVPHSKKFFHASSQWTISIPCLEGIIVIFFPQYTCFVCSWTFYK